MNENFKCLSCGLCCMNLDKSIIETDLDRGDGICRHLNLNTRLCNIYRNRPLECNVDAMYELVLSDKFTREEYYSLNYNICSELKNNFSKKGL